MAETAIKAFGRYLKMLRERRGLSLDEVATLSQTFPEKLNKGYLSRCENGHQKLAFPKVIALSRIYEVPSDVLLERMELDLELDRVGGPDTEGMSYAELTDAGKKALKKGLFLRAYGYLRDAVRRAGVDSVNDLFRDAQEQAAVSQMSCGTAARALGRDRFALHEFRYVESTGQLGEKLYPVILERIANCYTELREFDVAEEFADRAIFKAVASEDGEYLGYLYGCRARIALFRSQPEIAADYYRDAHSAFKRAGRTLECAISLNNLAQCYFDMKRFRSARRAAIAAQKLSREHGRERSRALSLILLGEIDEIENRPAKAIMRWKRASEIAKNVNDREVRFKAEFVLYRRAVRDGDNAVARAVGRRLRNLSPWIRAGTQELQAFKRMLQDGEPLSEKSVSGWQHSPLLPSN